LHYRLKFAIITNSDAQKKGYLCKIRRLLTWE
jgi:hypothetical protein